MLERLWDSCLNRLVTGTGYLQLNLRKKYCPKTGKNSKWEVPCGLLLKTMGVTWVRQSEVCKCREKVGVKQC